LTAIKFTAESDSEMISGRPFVKRFALCYRTVVCPIWLSLCNVGVLWPHGLMHEDETWHGGQPRPRPYCVRWEPSSPPPTRGTAPNFGPCLLWPNGWMDQDVTWTEVGFGPGNIVLDVDPALPQKRHKTPILGAW